MLSQPPRYGGLQIGDETVGRGTEAVLAHVRYVAVTVPARLLSPVAYVGLGEHTALHKLLVELSMAADAIVINDGLTRRNGLHALRFLTHREDVGVSQAIRGFEVVFAENVVVRHVAVATSGATVVGAVLPCGVVGSHHMTVDADGGIVAQVAIGS